MTRTDGAKKGRIFTVELKSRAALRSASLSNGNQEGVLIEGTLGRLTSASFLDGVVLEVVGSEGVLRLDLQRQEIRGNAPRGRAGTGGGEDA
ncbi:MAG TPA: hypothetical protein HA326_07970 [Thermoplasmata archaeon]|nr:hypothetical protein [Thermoplasmata archaeon]